MGKFDEPGDWIYGQEPRPAIDSETTHDDSDENWREDQINALLSMAMPGKHDEYLVILQTLSDDELSALYVNLVSDEGLTVNG